MIISTFFLTNHNHVGKFIKFLCVYPFGFGAIEVYKVFGTDLKMFTRYINMAVLGNIAMMMFVPDETKFRGKLVKLNCALMLIWLLQFVIERDWETVVVGKEEGFLFIASPLVWIGCHALYRISLVTLPCFESWRYLMLEPLSLIVMVLLYRKNEGKYRMEDHFGPADTLVASTMSLVSMIVDKFDRYSFTHTMDQNILNKYLVPVQVAVCLTAIGGIHHNYVNDVCYP
jgi:hypothetical protein